MSTLTINNSYKSTNSNYNLYVPFSCFDNGWGSGTTGGTATCEGSIDFDFINILNVQSGFIKFVSNGDNGQYGLYRVNNNPIILNSNINVTELFRITLFAQCGGTYPCSPTIYNTIYNIEYSIDGINNWQQFNLNVG